MTITDPATRIALNEVAATLKRMGDKIDAILNSHGVKPATEPQVTPILSIAGGFPQNEPSALQDIDLHSSGYSAGLSGRCA